MNREAIRKIQATLLKIDEKKPVFFNVAAYEELGLVHSKTKWGKSPTTGKETDIGYTFHLTEKGKRLLTLIV